MKSEDTSLMEQMGKKGHEIKVDEKDSPMTFFRKVIDIYRALIIVGKDMPANCTIATNNVVDGDLKKLCGIASRFQARRSLYELIDDLLFYILYRRETLLLRDSGNRRKIKEMNEILDEFSDYQSKFSKESHEKTLGDESASSHVRNGVHRLVVLLTHSCQLRCEYCRVRKFEAEMNEDVLFKSIRLLLTSIKREIQLQFFGGEPLLKFDLIKKAVIYAEKLAKEKRKKLQFILTTNGILLTGDKLSFLRKHNFLIEFSIDGDVETQLKTRKQRSGADYYTIVQKNLKSLFKSGVPHYAITVVTPETVSGLFENFKYLVGVGHRRIQINYTLGFFWERAAIEKLFEQFGNIINFIGNNENLEIELINLKKTRREPVVLNAELTVDCDGTIYLESGICLEEDFKKMKKDFRVADIDEIKEIGTCSTSRFGNFHRLVKVYSEHMPEFRRIIINNIELGNFSNKFLKRRDAQGDVDGEMVQDEK